jgi:hypothetical protein
MAICFSSAVGATRTMFAQVASSQVRSSLSERGRDGVGQCHPTTGEQALLDGGLRVANGVPDAVLALLEHGQHGDVYNCAPTTSRCRSGAPAWMLASPAATFGLQRPDGRGTICPADPDATWSASIRSSATAQTVSG